jgi:DNA-binding MarR family transcriptional regulator
MPSRRSSRSSTRIARPEADAHTEAGAALTAVVLGVFRLNGLLLNVADELSGPAQLTAARWQVLAAIADSPRSVAEISREMGLTRQAVQRVADVLVREEFAEYRENPAHRRAKLLGVTRAGSRALQVVGRRQRAWANRVADAIPDTTLRSCARTIERLVERIEELER